MHIPKEKAYSCLTSHDIHRTEILLILGKRRTCCPSDSISEELCFKCYGQDHELTSFASYIPSLPGPRCRINVKLYLLQSAVSGTLKNIQLSVAVFTLTVSKPAVSSGHSKDITSVLSLTGKNQKHILQTKFPLLPPSWEITQPFISRSKTPQPSITNRDQQLRHQYFLAFGS
jgi:hypothetical protein